MKRFDEEKLKELLIDYNPKLDHSRKNLVIDCPWCGHRECAISIKKDGNLFGCYRKKKCGEVANIWQVLKKIGRLGQFVQDGDLDKAVDNLNKLNLSLEAEATETLVLETVNVKPPLGWKQIYHDKYLDGRKYTQYTKYPVGRTILDKNVRDDYVIFLVNEGDETKGWVGRNTKDKDEITALNKAYENKHGIKNKIKRYFNTPGVDFGKLLYGINEIEEGVTDTAILVEGIFDKHAIDRHLKLHNDPYIKCLATFKADISDVQIVKLGLKGIKNLILFYDPDVIKKIKSNAWKLVDLFDTQIIFSSTGKDPDEMTTDELHQCLQKSYNATEFSTNFLEQMQLKF